MVDVEAALVEVLTPIISPVPISTRRHTATTSVQVRRVGGSARRPHSILDLPRVAFTFHAAGDVDTYDLASTVREIVAEIDGTVAAGCIFVAHDEQSFVPIERATDGDAGWMLTVEFTCRKARL